MSVNRDEFDFSSMGDRIALTSDWTSLLHGIYPTISTQKLYKRRLVTVTPSRLEFRPTKRIILLYAAIFIFGLVHLCALVLNLSWFTVQAMMLFGITSVFISTLSLFFCARPIIFDKQKGGFWKSWSPPSEDLARHQKTLNLDNIYAIQLIYTRLELGAGRVLLYELNLVFSDASRVHLVAHGQKRKIREAAEALSLFLDKPLWDAIDYLESPYLRGRNG